MFFGKRQICAFWLCVAGTCGSTMPISERHRAMKEDSIDVVNGRRLPEIGLMHKKISPCSRVLHQPGYRSGRYLHGNTGQSVWL